MSLADKMNKANVKVRKHTLIEKGENVMVEQKENKVIVPKPKTMFDENGLFTVHGALYTFYNRMREVVVKDHVNSVKLNIGVLSSYLVTSEETSYFYKCFDRFCKQAYESIGKINVELNEDDKLLLEYGMLDESKYQTEWETLHFSILEAMSIEVTIMSENLKSLI